VAGQRVSRKGPPGDGAYTDTSETALDALPSARWEGHVQTPVSLRMLATDESRPLWTPAGCAPDVVSLRTGVFEGVSALAFDVGRASLKGRA